MALDSTNYKSGNVSAYSIDSNTGALTQRGIEVGAGNAPNSVTVDPTGHFAYVANGASNTVSVYARGPLGQLTQGVGIATGDGPAAVTVDPSGSFVYATNYFGGSVSAYTLNAGTGELTQAGGRFLAGIHPISIAIAAAIK